MNKYFLSLPFIAALLSLASCGNDDGSNQVVSSRYIHKYGYAVSKEEWQKNNYPGQIITTLRNGVTITATYENGVLHGPCTHTHPHSQTVQYFYLYNNGELKKELVYDKIGMPKKEKVQLSPNRYSITMWYQDGTPMSVEDFANEELIEGEYFTLTNELESRVERGCGTRTRREQQGLLLCKDSIDAGYMIKQETFYPNGSTEAVATYSMNKRNGERRIYDDAGQFIAVEEWVDDQLHGKSTYFINGHKLAEVFFIHGAKNGVETHFVDGETIEHEIYWCNSNRHGPTKFYVGEVLVKTEWYYNNELVSKRKYDELDQLDAMISQSSAEFRAKRSGK